MTTPDGKPLRPKRNPGGKATRRRPGVPGPTPAVLQGFNRAAALTPDSDEPWWTNRTPAGKVLEHRRMGATWPLASKYAGVHAATAKRWNTRGEDALGDHESLIALAATGADDETLAYAAFHIADQIAEAHPVLSDLEAISRATGTEWRAALARIKILPQSKHDYAEVTKTEVSGPDGGPMALEMTQRIEGLLELARATREETGDGSAGD